MSRNRIIQSLRIAALLLGAWATQAQPVSGQQIQVADNHYFNPHWVNPANIIKDNLSRFSMLYQHRNLASFGWRSISQFVDFKSRAIGSRRGFGWGMNIANDVEHTERRLSVGFSFGANVFQTEYMSVGLGINLGFINWASSYRDVPVYQVGDPRLDDRVNFSELDAGAGLAFKLQTYIFRAGLDATAKQLPGSFLSADPIKGITLIPHVNASAKFLYSLAPDMYLGPWAYYRNAFKREDPKANPPETVIGNIQNAQADVGLKFELDYPSMWAGVGFRFGNHPTFGFGSAGLGINYGLQIRGTDTTDSRERIATFLDLVFSASYPLNSRAIFGPSAEIGLALSIGKVGSNVDEIDSVGLMRGAFWVNNGNMDTHKDKYLKANAPTGLYAESFPTTERVYLTYEWDDNFYLYTGVNKQDAGNLIAELGDDWVGVDGILENLVQEVIKEGLNPVHMDVSNTDSVEPLKDLISLDIQTKLRFDQVGADFGANGLVYQGELGYNNETKDTLLLPILYGDKDTVIAITAGQDITNLELSCLKIHAMAKKLEYELTQYYGDRLALINDLGAIYELEGKKIVLFKTPEVIPNNPNQQPFQVSVVNLGFIRDVNWKPTITDRKIKSKSNLARVRTRRERNGFRDPVSNETE